MAVDVIVYLEGFVDLAEERKRIEKAIEKNEKESAGLKGRLSNADFVRNAPPEVVEQGRATLAELAEKMTSLNEALKRLS